MPEVYEAIRRARIALVFVNTRFQAEFAFQELWRLNEDNLPIALHHGSLVGRAAAQGRGGDGARARCGPWSAPRPSTSASTGATSTWSSSSPRRRAPRGWCSGSAAPTTGSTSPATPSSCRPTASRCWSARPPARRSPRTPSTPSRSATARSTCWPSTSWACACSEPFDLVALYDEVRTAGPYRDLAWEDFEQVVDFVSTGGYALETYDRFARIVKGLDGLWRVRNDETALRHRMNVGAIVSPAMLSVRIAGRRGDAGPQDRRGRGGLPRGAGARRHLRLRRPGLAAGRRHRARRAGAPGAAARTPRCRPGAARSSRSRPSWPRRCATLMSDGAPLGGAAGRRPRMAGDPARPLGHPGRGRDAAGDLPARPAPLHGRLSVRGAPGPHHPGHAADPAAGARRRRAARASSATTTPWRSGR